MEWTGIVQEAPVIVAEGTYNAKLSSIEKDETRNKQMVRVGFTIEEEEYEGVEIYGLCSGVINEVSKLGRWIKAIKGRLPEIGEEIRSSSLLSCKCKVIVTHTRKDYGTTFANVTEVEPQ